MGGGRFPEASAFDPELDVGLRPVADLAPTSHRQPMADKICLRAGDRIALSGGYDMEPQWLSGKEFVEGSVVSFIPGQNQTPAAVIKLDAPITCKEIVGDTLVLQLRYVGAVWGATDTVHVELCDFTPEEKRWQDRRQGKWVESHATYQRLTG